MTPIEQIKTALDAAKLLLNMNANSNEFFERRAQIRPFIDSAIAALRSMEGMEPTPPEPRLTVEEVMEVWKSTKSAWHISEESELRDRLTKAAKP